MSLTRIVKHNMAKKGLFDPKTGLDLRPKYKGKLIASPTMAKILKKQWAKKAVRASRRGV